MNLSRELKKKGIALEVSLDEEDRYIFPAQTSDKTLSAVAEALDSLSLSGQEKFNVLASLASRAFSSPQSYSFINNPKNHLPAFADVNEIRILFELGYRPEPKHFYQEVVNDVFVHAPMYLQYVGLPWAPEEVVAKSEKRRTPLFLPYVHDSLDKIIKNLISQVYVGKSPGLTEDIRLGLKVLHALYSLEGNMDSGRFSLSRTHIPGLDTAVSFTVLNLPTPEQKAKVLQGAPMFPDLNKVKISLQSFGEPLSELVALRPMLSEEDYGQQVLERLIQEDYTVDPEELNRDPASKFVLPKFIRREDFYGTPLEYAAFRGNKGVYQQILASGAKEEKAEERLGAQVREVISAILAPENKAYIPGIINRYGAKFSFNVSYSPSAQMVTFERKEKISASFKAAGSQIILGRFKAPLSSLVELKEFFAEDAFSYNLAIFKLLKQGDTSVSEEALLEKHGYQPPTWSLEGQIKEVVQALYSREFREIPEILISRYNSALPYSLSFEREKDLLLLEDLAQGRKILFKIQPKRGLKVGVESFKGTLAALADLRDFYLEDESAYNLSIFKKLKEGDDSIPISELVKTRGYQINRSILFTEPQKGTFYGTPIEVCGFFEFTDLAQKLSLVPNKSLENGGFAKAILNGLRGKKPPSYRFKFSVGEEDLLRAKYHGL